MTGRKVLLIGWDAADWEVIRPLMSAGKMPNLHRLVETGRTAQINTLQPSFSPMLWTSIATGKRPFDHGIHGFTEPRPDGQGVQRVTNLSRKCKALWNILGQNGLRSIVVGWWPSYPAEPINGVMVSDQFQRVSPDFRLVPGMVHPPEFGEPLEKLRLNPEDLPADLVEFFVPCAGAIDQRRDERLHTLARITCECVNIHSAATWLMDREPWDLCAVYFDAIDHYGHGFMKFRPPRQDRITEHDFELYRNVLDAGYQLHDKMLGTLVTKAGHEARVIVLSDHGFHSGHLRPTAIPQFHAGPASEHRNNGVFVISGPGISPGIALDGVSLMDITPTVLSLFGLPAGHDMDGKSVVPETERIPGWEDVDGEDGRHPPHMRLDPLAATESLEQLVALGYVEEPDADHEKAVKRTIADLRTNLGESYQDAGRHAEATVILRELREADPDDQRIALRLFISAQALKRTDEMSDIAHDWNGRRRELYVQALARINEIRQANLSRQSKDGQAELKHLRRVCRYDPSLALYLLAQVFRARRKWSEALMCIDNIPPSDLIRPGLFTDRAELLGRLDRWGEARSLLQSAMATDPSDARVHFSLARVHLHDRDFAAAADAARRGLALLELDPVGHYLLGIALASAGRCEDAVTAFTRALAINPNFPESHLWLARIDPGHSGKFGELRDKIRQNSTTAPSQRVAGLAPRPVAFAASARELPLLSDEAVIVSGLPRSGTSMLMQMLAAGGLEILTDGLRQADEDNPRGYFEFDPVRQMSQGACWMEQAQGKATKIVAPMIRHLPDDVPCRVILIERNLDEILDSQQQMILRRGRVSSQTPARRERLKHEYLRLIIWTKGFLASRPLTSLMCVERSAVLRDPIAASEALSRFLGGHLNTSYMAAAVQPDLHRQDRQSFRPGR